MLNSCHSTHCLQIMTSNKLCRKNKTNAESWRRSSGRSRSQARGARARSHRGNDTGTDPGTINPGRVHNIYKPSDTSVACIMFNRSESLFLDKITRTCNSFTVTARVLCLVD
jgi:hypothetical protein